MESQILDLEKKYWHGMESQDFETLKSLTRFPCIVAGKSGIRSVDQASFQKMFEAGKDKQTRVIKVSDAKVQTINEDTAIIAYLIDLEYAGQSMSCACTSTWVKENDTWRCAMHTEADLEE